MDPKSPVQVEVGHEGEDEVMDEVVDVEGVEAEAEAGEEEVDPAEVEQVVEMVHQRGGTGLEHWL